MSSYLLTFCTQIAVNLINRVKCFSFYFVGGSNGPTDGDDEVFAVSIDNILRPLPYRGWAGAKQVLITSDFTDSKNLLKR